MMRIGRFGALLLTLVSIGGAAGCGFLAYTIIGLNLAFRGGWDLKIVCIATACTLGFLFCCATGCLGVVRLVKPSV